MTFAQKLLALRKQKGLSQEQLAERLLVSRQAISRWENGEVWPDAPNLVQISRLFGVSVDYLLHDEYGSDSDLPAVQDAAARLEARRKLDTAFFICVGVIATAAVWQAANIAYEKRLLWMLLAFTVQIAAAVAFKICLGRWPVGEAYRRQTKRKFIALVAVLVAWMALLPLARLLVGFAVGVMAGQTGHYIPHTSLYDGLLSVLLYGLLCGALYAWVRRHRDDGSCLTKGPR